MDHEACSGKEEQNATDAYTYMLLTIESWIKYMRWPYKACKLLDQDIRESDPILLTISMHNSNYSKDIINKMFCANWIDIHHAELTIDYVEYNKEQLIEILNLSYRTTMKRMILDLKYKCKAKAD